MITIRPSETRGATRIAWLDSKHTFSFGSYHDPDHMGFRNLRVINDDRVAPGGGFAPHGHRDMEIISYVVEGALEHKDSIGTGSVIRPGDVQRMSAGSGIRHSEFNASKQDPVRFLQIWIPPSTRDLPPSYEQRSFAPEERHNTLRLLASPDGAHDSVTIHADARLYGATLDADHTITHPIAPNRHVWLQIVRGAARLGDTVLLEGDGAALSREDALTLTGASDDQPAEVLVFELP